MVVARMIPELACVVTVILTPIRADGHYQSMRVEMIASKGCPARISKEIRVKGPQKIALKDGKVFAVWVGKHIRVK